MCLFLLGFYLINPVFMSILLAQTSILKSSQKVILFEENFSLFQNSRMVP